MTKKKRNVQDTTLINLRALKRRVKTLEEGFNELWRAVGKLERNARKVA